MNNASTIAVTILALCVGLAGAAGLVYLMDRGTGVPETASQPAPATPGTRSAPQSDSSPVPKPANVTETEKPVQLEGERARVVSRLNERAAEHLAELDSIKYWGEGGDERRRAAGAYETRTTLAWDTFYSVTGAELRRLRDQHVRDFRSMPELPILRHERLYLAASDADYYGTYGGHRGNVLDDLLSAIVEAEDWREGATLAGETLAKLLVDEYVAGWGPLTEIIEKGG